LDLLNYDVEPGLQFLSLSPSICTAREPLLW
jgi:hypothetical protein